MHVQVSREISGDGTAPLPSETAHNLHGPYPPSTHAQHQSQGRVLLTPSPAAAISGTNTSRGAAQHGFTPEPVRQPRLSDYQVCLCLKSLNRALLHISACADASHLAAKAKSLPCKLLLTLGHMLLNPQIAA